MSVERFMDLDQRLKNNSKYNHNQPNYFSIFIALSRTGDILCKEKVLTLGWRHKNRCEKKFHFLNVHLFECVACKRYFSSACTIIDNCTALPTTYMCSSIKFVALKISASDNCAIDAPFRFFKFTIDGHDNEI